MKLAAQKYISPLAIQGSFSNVVVEDVKLTHKRFDKYLAITYEMSYLRDGQRIVLDTKDLAFLGMNDSDVNSNRTATFSIPNPDYNSEIEGSEERITVPMIAYLQQHLGAFPEDFVMVDWGYPTYEDAVTYFIGGTLEVQEVQISQAFAKMWFLNTFIINGELIGNQFTFEEVL
ncbi:hypothetical protein ACM55H_05215 [Flavobacterium sp. ZT3R17]|uniref:hypothetical protein n=1 Tax=Flavobacterium cryoconiti TaxID=3398736 RepID=UPI003A855145